MSLNAAGPFRLSVLLAIALATPAAAAPSAADRARAPVVLVPDAVWDGVADAPQRGWIVVVRGSRIEAAGPAARVAAPAGGRLHSIGAALLAGA